MTAACRARPPPGEFLPEAVSDHPPPLFFYEFFNHGFHRLKRITLIFNSFNTNGFYPWNP
jgi:hypothetical protein